MHSWKLMLKSQNNMQHLCPKCSSLMQPVKLHTIIKWFNDTVIKAHNLTTVAHRAIFIPKVFFFMQFVEIMDQITM
jgi:hypothetical protein